MKAWFFLTDVAADEGAFCYVPGSHRLTAERLAWESAKSVVASSHPDRLRSRGSFRVDEDELAALGLPAPRRFAVPANTLIVADTFGFHARGPSARPSTRIELWAYDRRNPFLPAIDRRAARGCRADRATRATVLGPARPTRTLEAANATRGATAESRAPPSRPRATPPRQTPSRSNAECSDAPVAAQRADPYTDGGRTDHRAIGQHAAVAAADQQPADGNGKRRHNRKNKQPTPAQPHGIAPQTADEPRLP